MIRRPPRSTLDRSSAASDVYKRQVCDMCEKTIETELIYEKGVRSVEVDLAANIIHVAVSYTHLRAHETVLDLVCRLLLEKTKHTKSYHISQLVTLNIYA